MFDFGLRIRTLRERQHWSQEQLGRRIGRSKSVVSSYENNLKVPPLSVLTEMATEFHCSLDYLVGMEKTEMLSMAGLSDSQCMLAELLITEFREKGRKVDGLTERQQKILGDLIKEFARR